MCIGCVLGSGLRLPPHQLLPGPATLPPWAAGDADMAVTVYRQLPRWSRRLIDLLSDEPGRRFPLSQVQATVFAAGDGRFSLREVCDWVASYCAAAGRALAVQRETPSSGEAVYWMDEPAAGLFRAARPAR